MNTHTRLMVSLGATLTLAPLALAQNTPQTAGPQPGAPPVNAPAPTNTPPPRNAAAERANAAREAQNGGSPLINLLVVVVVAAAVAVGLAMLAMHLVRAYHPPAGIDALIVGLNNLSFGFLLVPVATGVVLLTAFAFIWHNASGQRPWPNAWW